jgi:hypothetical protein
MSVSLSRRRVSAAATLFLSVVIALAASPPARANHGPGASGGGSTVMSGEVLKPGAFEFSLREDFTEFQHVSAAEAVRRAQEGGDFDSLRRSFLTTADLSCGVLEDFQLGMSLGWFRGQEFLGADDTGETGRVDPRGLTDLVVAGKLRVMEGPYGQLALMAGVKIPVGNDHVRLNNGERLSPTDQPSNGAFDFPFGAGWSRFLTSQLTVDASAAYTARTQHDGFKSGDRLDVGVALAWRLTGSIESFPQPSVFTELNYVGLAKDRDGGVHDGNSGSQSLYVTAGVRLRFDARTSFSIAPALPVWTDLNGNQTRPVFKLAATLSYSF